MRRAPTGRSVAQQALALRARYPEGRVDLRRGRLTWTGRLTPTSLSRTYAVEVRYRDRSFPQVRVLEPELDSRLGESLPHVYREGTLCLHLRNDWFPSMSIADSIVPWSAEWLAFYEIWKATGDWHGGGEWPPAAPSD